MSFCVKILLLAVICVHIVRCEKYGENEITETVQTSSGAVRGKVLTTQRHQNVYQSFKGIPYAKVPTGDLRFKAPEKVDNWSPRVLDAFNYGNSCHQSAKFTHEISTQSEDCLFLNVFTPAITTDKKLPVIFYIHGGGFIEGAGDEFNPEFLIEKNLIVVTINYRLGVFGFLSLGMSQYSGNMGMKDQQLALEWTYENIHKFGGNNKQITITGNSAGAASVHYHTLSERSRRSFVNAIAMSGSALNRWALSEKDSDEDMFNMFAIAQDIGQAVSDSDELLEFLKVVPAEELMKHTVNTKFGALDKQPITLSVEWNPTIENEDAVRPFLTREPEEIMRTTKINVTTIFGQTTDEWLCFAKNEVDNPAVLEYFNKKFQIDMPFRGYRPDFESKEYQQLAAEVREHYFGDEVVDINNLKTYIDLVSDVFFIHAIDKAAKLQATAGKTYYFKFAVESELNLFKVLFNVDKSGTGHEDDRCYVFRCGLIEGQYEKILTPEPKTNSVAYKTIERMTQMWSNFARNGSPRIENELEDVKPISGDKVHYFEIRNGGFVTGINPRQDTADFWSRLYKKYQVKHTERDEL